MLHFIVNLHSKSGYARVIWGKIEEVLQEQGTAYETYFTEYKGHATKIAEDLTFTEQNIRIVVLGGDGTVNEVVEGIGDFEHVILGYIPTGSSNDLARSLGLPTDPKKAILNILSPKYFIQMDIGEVRTKKGKRRFVVSNGIGLDASICEEALDSKIKKVLNTLKLGKLTYVLIALKQILLFQMPSSEILIDGKQKRSYKGIYFISSHIHKYEGGGLMICPKASYNDGKIDVCVVKNLKKLKLLCLLPSAYFGKHTKSRGVDMIRCNEITIKTSRKMNVHTDGESMGMQNEISVHTLNEKLTIIARNV
ncbi:diacylglycerol/lipid kinase family protein [Konateibacter massiliensis]|uniref:diacylglycerol/lipid kinase family protein n=1 Tax=Konateibacter massiliensis TaxID=2002841 RepID=UPI000C1584D0|nr:diacylglycerol kinase family protein [Konateibacter massiliensis]